MVESLLRSILWSNVMRCMGTAGVHLLENVTWPCASSVTGFSQGRKSTDRKRSSLRHQPVVVLVHGVANQVNVGLLHLLDVDKRGAGIVIDRFMIISDRRTHSNASGVVVPGNAAV